MAAFKERIADYFDTYHQDVTSHQYCINEIREAIVELGLDNARLDEKVDDAAALIGAAVTIDRQWESNKNLPKGRRPQASKIDNQLDPALSSVYTVIKGHARSPADNEYTRAAKLLLEVYFPSGVYPITSQRHERQHALVNDLTETMRREHPDELALLNLEPQLDTVDDLNHGFGTAISLDNSTHLTFDKVREARAKADQAFYKVVAVIVGDYVDDPDTMNQLLAAFGDQQERVAMYMRNRGGTPPAVDPDSGDVTDGPQPIDSDEPKDDEPVDVDDTHTDQPEPV